MTPRLLQTRVRRRYRAGARFALLASLLVGLLAQVATGVGQTTPSGEPASQISLQPAPAHQQDPAPPRPLPPPQPLPPPDPEIETTSLPPFPTSPAIEPAALLELEHAPELGTQVGPSSRALVERLVL